MLLEMSDRDRAAALKSAGETRSVRAEVKQLLQCGSLTLLDVFERASENDLLAGIKVGTIITSLPPMGKVSTKRLMEEIGIAENRTIRGLGSRQREALIERFS